MIAAGLDHRDMFAGLPGPERGADPAGEPDQPDDGQKRGGPGGGPAAEGKRRNGAGIAGHVWKPLCDVGPAALSYSAAVRKGCCFSSSRLPGSESSKKAIVSRKVGSIGRRSEEHTSELQSRSDLVCRLLLEKKKTS